MLDGKLSSEKSPLTLSSWLNSLSWPWDPVSRHSKLWQSTHSDACLLQVLKMLGTSLVLFITQLLSSNYKGQSRPTWINTIHTYAPAPMMPTTSPNYLEITAPASKPFLATALKQQAMLSAAAEQNPIDQSFVKTHSNLAENISCLIFLLIMNYLYIKCPTTPFYMTTNTNFNICFIQNSLFILYSLVSSYFKILILN